MNASFSDLGVFTPLLYYFLVEWIKGKEEEGGWSVKSPTHEFERFAFVGIWFGRKFHDLVIFSKEFFSPPPPAVFTIVSLVATRGQLAMLDAQYLGF